jgi:hypothetical protein
MAITAVALVVAVVEELVLVLLVVVLLLLLLLLLLVDDDDVRSLLNERDCIGRDCLTWGEVTVVVTGGDDEEEVDATVGGDLAKLSEDNGGVDIELTIR